MTEAQVNESEPTPPRVHTTIGTMASSGVVYNTLEGQQTMLVTEDALKLELLNLEASGEARKGWIAPLGLLVACVLAVVTAQFQSRFGMSADAWQAVFVLSSVVSALWFLWEVVRAWSNRTTIDTVIRNLKAKAGRN